MYDYADKRTLLLREYGNLHNRNTLKRVTLLHVPPEEVTADETPQTVLRLISEINTHSDEHGSLVHYEIEDKRLIHELGASGALQEVVVAIVTGAAGSASTILLQQVMAWCAGKYRKDNSPEKRIDHATSGARDLVVRQFSPQGVLEILDTSSTEERSKVVIKDSQGTLYEVKIQHKPPYATQARKIRKRQVE